MSLSFCSSFNVFAKSEKTTICLWPLVIMFSMILADGGSTIAITSFSKCQVFGKARSTKSSQNYYHQNLNLHLQFFLTFSTQSSNKRWVLGSVLYHWLVFGGELLGSCIESKRDDKWRFSSTSFLISLSCKENICSCIVLSISAMLLLICVILGFGMWFIALPPGPCAICKNCATKPRNWLEKCYIVANKNEGESLLSPRGYPPSSNSYWSRARIDCFDWLAWANIDVAAWFRICCFERLVVSAAKSASITRPIACSVITDALLWFAIE